MSQINAYGSTNELLRAVQAPSLEGNGDFAHPIAAALQLLLQAHEYARSLSRDPWDFAVELPCLCDARLTVNDVRWLAYRGYVEHAVETTKRNGRTFRDHGRRGFLRGSCFTLTEKGVRLARRLRETAPNGTPPIARSVAGAKTGLASPARSVEDQHMSPSWDSARRELRVSGVLVKQFKLPSPNQERVLNAFDEENWAIRIDDPLPPVPDLDPKRRLHDTIKSLNRHQKHRCLRFVGDGRGEGVLWQALPITAMCD